VSEKRSTEKIGRDQSAAIFQKISAQRNADPCSILPGDGPADSDMSRNEKPLLFQAAE
jgi:hypothetical protein